MPSSKRILVCPLDWGLGHATRCVPVIRELLKQNADVILAADGPSYCFLKEEFFSLPLLRFPSYRVAYPASSSTMNWFILHQLPKIFYRIRKENSALKQMVHKYMIDGIVSDNRYGLYSDNKPSVFITHQMMIKSPILENLLHRIVLSYINRYTYCWIPDVPEEYNLSGDLSHLKPVPENALFTGPLSRFESANEGRGTSDGERVEQTDNLVPRYGLAAVISGPEPQRSVFEALLTEQMADLPFRTALVRGVPSGARSLKAGSETVRILRKKKMDIFSHLPTAELQELMQNSKVIISRPGYSTIMDLAALGKKAILIPTPGQTEQEYLSVYHHSKNHFLSQQQRKINIKKGLLEIDKYKGCKVSYNNSILQESVKAFLGKC